MRRSLESAVILGSGVFFSIASGEPIIFAGAVVFGFIHYRGLN